MSSAALCLHAPEPLALAREIIAQHSKSFALASKLLPPRVRDDAVVLYAFCRRVDDAVDSVAGAEQARALCRLRAELDAVYGGATLGQPLLCALQRLVQTRGVPRLYADELLLGMQMDVEGTRYATVHDLLVYCYRVAGTVGLMMCHAMGVRSPQALLHAAHLGIAMQLTNIARDVAEDWTRGRLYLPDELLARHGLGALRAELGQALPDHARPALAAATAELLALSDRYYRSGDAGLRELSPRCALAVRAARLIYADIGRELRARACDPSAGRAVVGTARKLWLALRAAAWTLWSWPTTWRAPDVQAPSRTLPLHAALPASGGQ